MRCSAAGVRIIAGVPPAASTIDRVYAQTSMRIAAIDIGTNSVHMIVVRVRPDLSFEVIDREKVMVRLGAGGLDGKALTAEAMTAALQALSKFKRLAESHGVDKILAAATSATREARNGGEFLARIERETGIRPRVISGVEEARLIHQAAVYGVDVAGGRAVVIDIGGGSVEITLGTATSMQLARSFKIGAIRLTERFVHSDPITERDERKLVEVRPRRDRSLLRSDHRHRLRSRDRHVRHDSEPRAPSRRRRRAADRPRSCATCTSRPSRSGGCARR